MKEIKKTSYNPAEADVYVDHLAEMSEFVEIIAAEDILNEFGVLLVKKGTPIKKAMADRLLGHKMQKTIDEVICVTSILSQNDIYEDIIALITEIPDFWKIHLCNDFENKLKHLCTVKTIPRVLLQKLTVLKQQFGSVYRRSLFAAWFGALVSTEMELELAETSNTFAVGLFHDLGLLHLPASLVERVGGYDEQEWQVFESHVMISKLIVENASMFPIEVSSGIIQHHERCDGTGYPRELRESRLGISGQIIAMSDMIFNIRTGEFGRHGKKYG